MPRPPSIVPESANQDVYQVIDDLDDRLGRIWREADAAATDLETVIADLWTGSIPIPSGSLLSIPLSIGRGMSPKMSLANCDGAAIKKAATFGRIENRQGNDQIIRDEAETYGENHHVA